MPFFLAARLCEMNCGRDSSRSDVAIGSQVIGIIQKKPNHDAGRLFVDPVEEFFDDEVRVSAFFYTVF